MATKKQEVQINAPKLQTVEIAIVGTAPYVQNKFSAKAKEKMIETQEAGSVAKGKKKREPKDFHQCYLDAMHISHDDWHGIPAPAFRCAMISACRLVGFQMTRAKLAVFVEADGFDKDDGTPLVKITKGKPQEVKHYVRNETGVVDIRPRPMWPAGWKAVVRITFDTEMFSLEDISNLMARVGLQVGIGEGRPDSKKSCGMGWGTFSVAA